MLSRVVGVGLKVNFNNTRKDHLRQMYKWKIEMGCYVEIYVKMSNNRCQAKIYALNEVFWPQYGAHHWL